MQFHVISFTHQFKILMLINKKPNFITDNSVHTRTLINKPGFSSFWIPKYFELFPCPHLQKPSMKVWNCWTIGSGVARPLTATRIFSSLGHTVINLKYPVGLALVEKLISIYRYLLPLFVRKWKTASNLYFYMVGAFVHFAAFYCIALESQQFCYVDIGNHKKLQ